MKLKLVRYLNLVDKNPDTIRNVNRELTKQLNLKDIKFPNQKKGLSKTIKKKIKSPLKCLVKK